VDVGTYADKSGAPDTFNETAGVVAVVGLDAVATGVVAPDTVLGGLSSPSCCVEVMKNNKSKTIPALARICDCFIYY